MNTGLAELFSLLESALVWAQANILSIDALLRGWVFIQLGVAIGCYIFAALLAGLIEGPLEDRLRAIKGKPELLRFLAIILRRLRVIVFVLLLWVCYFALREITWPSRSYLIGIAASLASAWVVISILSRIIRNPTVSRIVALTAWTAAALNILGLLNPTVDLLESVSFGLGGVTLSVWSILKGVVLLATLLWLASALSRQAEHRLRGSDDLTPSLQVLIAKLIKIALVAIAIFASLSSIGIDLTALAVFSGAVGLGIGFGLQKVVSNFISGIIILLDKSIKPGDVISLGDTFGWITTLRARYVSVVTRDGREFLIPNEDFITQQVINWSFSSKLIRIEVTFGVSYDSDPHQVRKIAVEAARSPDRVANEPAPVCHLSGFGDSSIDFVLRFWIKDPEQGVMNVRGLVLLALWDAFKAQGISIPFPHREVIMRNPVEVRPPD